MSPELQIYQPTSPDVNCVALHKIAKIHGLELPDNAVHVYLAGTLTRMNDPTFQKRISRFVVDSLDKIALVEERQRNSISPNALPYLLSRYTGEFRMDLGARIGDDSDQLYAQAFSIAQFYAERMGKGEEGRIYGIIALNPEGVMRFLSTYYSHLEAEPNFEITDEDHKLFKKELRDKKVTSPSSIKTNVGKDILL